MRVIYTLILAIFFIVSCNNEDDIIGGGDSGSLSFSVDTLLFDTVFSTENLSKTPVILSILLIYQFFIYSY